MRTTVRVVVAFFMLLGSLLPLATRAQTEILVARPIGMDTQFVFPHVSLPGAIGIDFSFAGGFGPTYPEGESHTVVITFEWGPTATGPWTASPDHVNTVPGGTTDTFATGVFNGPADAPFVALHFFAGAIMFVSGEFAHISAVPEPSEAALMGMGAMLLMALLWRRGTFAHVRARSRLPA